jgi:hypothetical protein
MENDANEWRRERMMATREQIRNLIARVFDVEDCADEVLGYIEQGAPALMYYFLRKAAGHISSTGRRASLDFLRMLPEPFFGYVLESALDFFRQPTSCIELIRAEDPEFVGLAFALWLDDERLERCDVPDDGLYRIVLHFADLVLLEEEERAGAAVWLDHYPMLARATTGIPPRFPAPEWLTPH